MRFKRKAHVRTSAVPRTACPACGALLEAATGARLGDDDGTLPPAPTPRPGCYTVCGYCGMLLRFTDGLRLVIVPQDEADAARAAQPMLAEFQKRFGDPTRWRH